MEASCYRLELEFGEWIGALIGRDGVPLVQRGRNHGRRGRGGCI